MPTESVTAIVRHTDMARTGHITCSNPLFDRLMQNVVWGQRGNFLDIPTDCPQRDERLGWTGDANVFCQTAAFNYDVRKFFKKWLADVRNEQFDSGELTHVIPNTLGSHKSSCDAVWADCITMIPYKLYEMYGDISFLSDNYEAMKKYIGAFELYKEDGLVKKGHQYGDWLSLDTEYFFGDNEAHGGTDKYLLANVFYSVSVNIVSKTAKILGFKNDYKKYCDLYKQIVKGIRREYFTPNGRILSETITAQTVALTFNIVPEKYRTNMAAALAENVKKHGYHVTTGFIGTAYLLYALSDNGYFDVAEKVLMNEEYPGWLYEVKSGATTIWERWNSLMPDGTPNPQGMTSFNHYAYGSVMEFVYRRVAGINAVEPGFKKVRISPHTVDGIDSLTASYQSVNGEIISGYKIENDKITYSVEIPEKIYGEVYLPECEGPVFIGSGKFSKEIFKK